MPLLLLAVAFAARAPFFGNPVLGDDEQFYLLVGDRLLQGQLPYIDIWDRKPVGLFLIYAAIRLLGGEGIVQYQVVATLFAAATAMVVVRIAQLVSPGRGAVFAGVTYLLWLNLFGGQGGQSPVFYNLPVAAAALVVLRTLLPPGRGAGLPVQGAIAMLLAGLAMQVKYAAVFEGVFLGCALLLAAWRAGASGLRLATFGAAWAGCALIPTAVAFAAYASLGEAHAFVFANFLSVLLRNTAAGGSPFGRLALMAALLLPLAAAAVLGLRRVAPERAGAGRFVAAWALVSAGAILVFGTYYTHYALPLLVPLSAATAPLLAAEGRAGARRMVPMAVLSAVAVIAAAVLAVLDARARGSGAQARLLAGAVALAPGEMIYVFDGEPVFYLLTRSPLPTRFAFPTHLNDLREAGAAGIDRMAELCRIIAAAPAYIVTGSAPRRRNDPAAWALMATSLASAYRLEMAVPVGNRSWMLYRREEGRRPGPPACPGGG